MIIPYSLIKGIFGWLQTSPETTFIVGVMLITYGSLGAFTIFRYLLSKQLHEVKEGEGK